MRGPLDLRALVLLLARAFTACAAYRHPAAGAALLVGVGVLALRDLLLGSGDSEGPPAS
ncbi:hypothetical protein [Streptomyces sp. NPDC101149]|uniref:hypothetical protein n=1 Tax=Streptomyces sp. NPDC101149 TaxID=3366113 RepID=UPI0037F264A7